MSESIPCSICGELRASPSTHLAQVLCHAGVRNAVLAASEKYAVIPSLGPLVYGHCLLVSKSHTTSIFSDINLDAEELGRVLRKFFDLACATQSDTLFCFEHGMGLGVKYKTVCTTDHAHLHMMPLQPSVARRVQKAFGVPAGNPVAIEEIPDRVSGLAEYVTAFAIGDKGEAVDFQVCGAVHLPSQYMRGLVATELGLADWDWKRELRPDVLLEMLSMGFEVNKALTA